MKNDKLREFVDNLPLEKQAKKELTEAFESALDDVRQGVEIEVRKELSEKYENDMKILKEGMAELMEAKIANFEDEIRRIQNEATVEKAKLSKALTEAKEKYRQEAKAKAAHLSEMVMNRLEGEMGELHQNLVEHRKAMVAALNEEKARFQAERKNLTRKTAAVMEKVVNDHMRASIEPLMEDIVAARKKSFGMEIFEAFEDAYKKMFLERNDPAKKMIAESNRAKVELRKKLLEEQKKREKAEMEAKLALVEAKKIQQKALREAKIMSLISTIPSKTGRETMKTILESVPYEKIELVFRAQKPKILRDQMAGKGESRKKTALHESANTKTVKPVQIKNVRFLAGEKVDQTVDETDEEIRRLRNLAGM